MPCRWVNWGFLFAPVSVFADYAGSKKSFTFAVEWKPADIELVVQKTNTTSAAAQIPHATSNSHTTATAAAAIVSTDTSLANTTNILSDSHAVAAAPKPKKRRLAPTVVAAANPAAQKTATISQEQLKRTVGLTNMMHAQGQTSV